MDDFVTIEHVGNEAIARMLEQRLGEAGIRCLIAPTNLAAVAQAGAAYTVSVPAADVATARALLGEEA